MNSFQVQNCTVETWFCAFSDKEEKRPITSSSVSFTNSLEDASKDSELVPTRFKPGRPGFSGSKLKINQRSKN